MRRDAQSDGTTRVARKKPIGTPRRLMASALLLAAMWFILPMPFPGQAKPEQNEPAHSTTWDANAVQDAIENYTREGMARKRGAWAAHPVLSILVYLVLYVNLFYIIMAVVLRIGPRKSDRLHRTPAYLLGLGAHLVLWTACWGYRHYLWYIGVCLYYDIWFMGTLALTAQLWLTGPPGLKARETRDRVSAKRKELTAEGPGLFSSEKRLRKRAVPLRAVPAPEGSRSPQQRVPSALEREADALEAQGDYSGALRLYEEFLRGNPGVLQALNNAATLHLRMDNPRKAAELLDEAVRLSPGYVKAWNNLGVARMELRDLVRAEEAFETALRLEPQNSIARQGAEMVKNRSRSLGIRTTEERGTSSGDFTCASCGGLFSERGQWSPENKAIGGALCRSCGRFYCEPCVARGVYSGAGQTFRCGCGNATVTPSGFNNFEELALFRE